MSEKKRRPRVYTTNNKTLAVELAFENGTSVQVKGHVARKKYLIKPVNSQSTGKPF